MVEQRKDRDGGSGTGDDGALGKPLEGVLAVLDSDEDVEDDVDADDGDKVGGIVKGVKHESAHRCQVFIAVDLVYSYSVTSSAGLGRRFAVSFWQALWTCTRSRCSGRCVGIGIEFGVPLGLELCYFLNKRNVWHFCATDKVFEILEVVKLLDARMLADT